MSIKEVSIEFHDSVLWSCSIDGDVLLLNLNPAYIYVWEKDNEMWSGTGWHQEIAIEVLLMSEVHNIPKTPVKLSNGELKVVGHDFDDNIPVPLNFNSSCQLILYLENGIVFQINGSKIRIGAEGEAKFIEKLPDDFAPE